VGCHQRSEQTVGKALSARRLCAAGLALRSIPLAVILAVLPLATHAEPACDDMMLVFDASGSMGIPNRTGRTGMQIARQSVAHTLPQVARIRSVGLAVYGPGEQPVHQRCRNHEVRLLPTRDAAERIMAELARLRPAGMTPLTAAVREAAEVLDHRTRPATIVLVTDGEESCGGDPCALAEELKAEGVRTTVHVVAYAVTHPRAVSGMSCLASQTGGQFFSTQSLEELTQALQHAFVCPIVSQRNSGQPPISRASWFPSARP
jgi:Ca-activated chloride channel family protein